MTPDLESALAECDRLGVHLWHESGKVRFRGEVALPADVVDALRLHRAELVNLLVGEPVADPDTVLFVSLRMEVTEVPAFLAKTARAIYVSGRPRYRLTPQLAMYLAEAIDSLSERTLDGRSDTMRRAVDLWCELRSWVCAHYRTDQIRRAQFGKPTLPNIPALGSEAKSFKCGQTSANTGKPDSQASARSKAVAKRSRVRL